MNSKIQQPVDERGIVQKLSSGDIGALDAADVANAATMAAGFVGSAIPGVDALQVGFSGIAGHAEATRDYSRISQRFGNVKQLSRSSPAFKRALSRIDDRWKDSMIETGVQVGGGILGGAALGALIGMPIPLIGAPIGFVIGSIVGGMIANNIYQNTWAQQVQDPIAINEQICKMREAGEEVPKELVFAALAANLSGKDGRRVDKLLKRHTGTTLFSEALAKETNIDRIGVIMNDPVVRNAIRVQTLCPRDTADPAKSVAEQYAEMINSGQMDPRDLLIPGGGILGASAPSVIKDQMNVQVPMTPQVNMGQVRGYY
jgi:hypothetical protein